MNAAVPTVTAAPLTKTTNASWQKLSARIGAAESQLASKSLSPERRKEVLEQLIKDRAKIEEIEIAIENEKKAVVTTQLDAREKLLNNLQEELKNKEAELTRRELELLKREASAAQSPAEIEKAQTSDKTAKAALANRLAELEKEAGIAQQQVGVDPAAVVDSIL